MALRSISCARPGISLRSRAYQPHRPVSVICQSTQPEGRKVTFNADMSKLADALNSQQFKEELSPLSVQPRKGERHAMITHESPEILGFPSRSASSTTTHRPQHKIHTRGRAGPGNETDGSCIYRAYCEPAPDGEGVKVMVVSTAFEGKKARGRERLVLKALGQGELEELTVVAMTPSESAAMLKKWC